LIYLRTETGYKDPMTSKVVSRKYNQMVKKYGVILLVVCRGNQKQSKDWLII